MEVRGLLTEEFEKKHQELITKVITNEEASFNKTVDQGLSMLEALTKNGGMLSHTAI